MSPKALKIASALLVSSALTLLPAAEACAGGTGGSQPRPPSGPACNPGGGISINKPITINKNVNIYKPVTINKNVNIYKPITIDKSITINKTIDASKNININKTIIINKGGGSAEASAWASAWAQASASASANASVSNNITIYSGYNEYITVNNHIGGGGEIGVNANVSVSPTCEMADATVIKALHAVCIAPDGREFPASHMTEQTWIDSGYEGEVLRCIPGAHLKITMGDVLQSDQGMAGTFASGRELECSPYEALRHFKDGMLKCTPKVWVKDCTERANLRRWGTGDMFFSFRTRVCAPKTVSAPMSREIELSGMTLTGGVGDQ